MDLEPLVADDLEVLRSVRVPPQIPPAGTRIARTGAVGCSLKTWKKQHLGKGGLVLQDVAVVVGPDFPAMFGLTQSISLSNHVLANFQGLVPGCTEADFCK